MGLETQNILLIIFNLVGKCGVTMGFAIIYIWSAEIFPTSVRTSLMGISAMIGQVGQILAPFIADIVSSHKPFFQTPYHTITVDALWIICKLLTISNYKQLYHYLISEHEYFYNFRNILCLMSTVSWYKQRYLVALSLWLACSLLHCQIQQAENFQRQQMKPMYLGKIFDCLHM